jgi:hypothetical protein
MGAMNRRSFLNTTPLVLAPVFWHPTAGPDPSFPSHPLEMAREMVGASHVNLARVKELLAIRPTLARAAYDWGFGDWEDALGAASHVGSRAIAELLLANGARPTIFSAAMLGQLDVVKAFVAASPGIEATPGPHGITLFRHATAGGPQAQVVVDYLKTLPGADKRPETQPLSAEEMAALAGDYVYGPAADERIAIAVSNNALQFTRSGRVGRGLAHIGDSTFFPAGAPLVRIRFRESQGAMTLTVHDPDLLLEARRTK